MSATDVDYAHRRAEEIATSISLLMIERTQLMRGPGHAAHCDCHEDDGHEAETVERCQNCEQLRQWLLAVENRLRMIDHLADLKTLHEEQNAPRRRLNFGERADGSPTAAEDRYRWMKFVLRGLGAVVDDGRERGIL